MTVQNPPGGTPCRFESDPRHQIVYSKSFNVNPLELSRCLLLFAIDTTTLFGVEHSALVVGQRDG